MNCIADRWRPYPQHIFLFHRCKLGALSGAVTRRPSEGHALHHAGTPFAPITQRAVRRVLPLPITKSEGIMCRLKRSAGQAVEDASPQHTRTNLASPVELPRRRAAE